MAGGAPDDDREAVAEADHHGGRQQGDEAGPRRVGRRCSAGSRVMKEPSASSPAFGQSGAFGREAKPWVPHKRQDLVTCLHSAEPLSLLCTCRHKAGDRCARPWKLDKADKTARQKPHAGKLAPLLRSPQLENREDQHEDAGDDHLR